MPVNDAVRAEGAVSAGGDEIGVVQRATEHTTVTELGRQNLPRL